MQTLFISSPVSVFLQIYKMTPILLKQLTLAICLSLPRFIISDSANNEVSFVKNTPRNPKGHRQ